MKSVFFIITFCFASFLATAQEFHVISVKGSVAVVGKTGNLKANDKIKADDKLKFSSPTDAVAVVGTKTGRFIISPSSKSKDGELLSIVKEVITPGTKKLSTRSGLFNNALDFTQYFKDTVLFLPVMKYPVNATYRPTDKSFFFIRYTYNGEDINKKIETSGDTLVIDRSQLFSVDKKQIDPGSVSNMRLFHMNNSEITLFAKMNVVSPDPAELAEGVKVLKKLYTAKEVREEAISYLTELYGKLDDSNFDAWFRKIN